MFFLTTLFLLDHGNCCFHSVLEPFISKFVVPCQVNCYLKRTNLLYNNKHNHFLKLYEGFFSDVLRAFDRAICDLNRLVEHAPSNDERATRWWLDQIIIGPGAFHMHSVKISFKLHRSSTIFWFNAICFVLNEERPQHRTFVKWSLTAEPVDSLKSDSQF